MTGGILHRLAPEEMVRLSSRYNYPIFLERQWEAGKFFHSIEGVAKIRTVVAVDKMGTVSPRPTHAASRPPDWSKQLAGPADRIAWREGRLQ